MRQPLDFDMIMMDFITSPNHLITHFGVQRLLFTKYHSFFLKSKSIPQSITTFEQKHVQEIQPSSSWVNIFQPSHD